MPRTIKQEVKISAEPQAVYDALMDSRLHTKFTGAPAKVSKKVGGAVSCYDGFIEAVNLDLESGKRIVQAWRGKDWKVGEWSVAMFDLKKTGKKTRLVFTQTGVPDKHVAHIKKGRQRKRRDAAAFIHEQRAGNPGKPWC